MDKSYEYRGYWFLPDSPEEKVSGILKIDPSNGIYLELIGSLCNKSNNIEIILGNVAGKDRYITLHHCFEHRMDNMFGIPELGTYYCNYVIVGKHFQKEKEILFYNTRISYYKLNNWYNESSPFEFDYNRKDSNGYIKFSNTVPFQTALSNGLTISLQSYAEFPISSISNDQATVKQKLYLSLETTRKRSFRNILQDIHYIQDLLSLLVYKRHVLTKEIFCYSTRKPYSANERVRIFLNLRNDPFEFKDVHSIDMLASYESIRPYLESVFTKWFLNAKVLKNIIFPLTETFYSQSLRNPDRFLYLCRSIEAFHREILNNGKRCKLEKGIQEILTEYSSSYNSTLRIRSKPRFAKEIVSLRNNLTHTNPINYENDRMYLGMYYLNEKLKLIITCALLNYLGVPQKSIKKMIEDSRLFSHYRNPLPKSLK